MVIFIIMIYKKLAFLKVALMAVSLLFPTIAKSAIVPPSYTAAEFSATYTFQCENSSGKIKVSNFGNLNLKFEKAYFNGQEVEFLFPLMPLEDVINYIKYIEGHCDNNSNNIAVNIATVSNLDFLNSLIISIFIMEGGVQMYRTSCEPKNKISAFIAAEQQEFCQSIIGKRPASD